ncbi:predicted GPI-anchored protein 58 [Panicum virgatum]|uniref:predicted GPI-anchored protein 58 n=1 Tax=Panicum virgatum TaxID=38727 RepID=UPI0019D58C1B|nr:predicted GPI-anchored protein 58 [Panicum virgatum]
MCRAPPPPLLQGAPLPLLLQGGAAAAVAAAAAPTAGSAGAGTDVPGVDTTAMAAPPLFFSVPTPPLLQGAGTAAAALDPAALPVPARRRRPRALRRAARAPAGPCAAHTEQPAPATGLAAPCVPAWLSVPREIRVWAPAHAHSPVWPPQGAAAAPTAPWRAPAPHASDAWPPYGAVAAPTAGSAGAWPPLAPTVPAPATAVLAMVRVPAPAPNAPAWPAFVYS